MIQVKSDSGDSAKPLPAGNLVIQVIQQNLPAGSDSGLEVIQVIQLISDSGDSGDSA